MEKQARFKLDGYRISNSSIVIKDGECDTLNFEFDLDGNLVGNNFTLIMGIKIAAENDVLRINIALEGNFTIDTDSDEATSNGFLYINAPAIVFPYMRAYIATLTSLSGINAIILPTLNLTGEGEKLKAIMNKKSLSNLL